MLRRERHEGRIPRHIGMYARGKGQEGSVGAGRRVMSAARRMIDAEEDGPSRATFATSGCLNAFSQMLDVQCEGWPPAYPMISKRSDHHV